MDLALCLVLPAKVSDGRSTFTQHNNVRAEQWIKALLGSQFISQVQFIRYRVLESLGDRLGLGKEQQVIRPARL